MGALEDTTLENLVEKIELEIISPLLVLLIAIATVVFFWGVIQFIANSGNAEGQKTGRRHIIWGLLGLAIMGGAFGIVNIIANSFPGI